MITHLVMTSLTQNHPLEVTFNDVTTGISTKQHQAGSLMTCCVHCLVATTKSRTPASRHPVRRPLSHCDSPVFVSDSDGDEDIVIKSTWRTRHSKPPPKTNLKNALLNDKRKSSPSPASLANPKCTLVTPEMDDPTDSEEEFVSLLDLLKKKEKSNSTSFSPRVTHGNTFMFLVSSLPLLWLILFLS